MTTPAGDAELIERLRRLAGEMERFLGPPEMAPGPDPDDLREAADRLAAANAEIASWKGRSDEAQRWSLDHHAKWQAAEARLAEVTAERDAANNELRCPIGLDDVNEICSAGTCMVCLGKRAQHYYEKATAAEARIASLTKALIDARKMIQTRETVDELGWGKGTSPATRLLAKIDAVLSENAVAVLREEPAEDGEQQRGDA